MHCAPADGGVQHFLESGLDRRHKDLMRHPDPTTNV